MINVNKIKRNEKDDQYFYCIIYYANLENEFFEKCDRCKKITICTQHFDIAYTNHGREISEIYIKNDHSYYKLNKLSKQDLKEFEYENFCKKYKFKGAKKC